MIVAWFVLTGLVLLAAVAAVWVGAKYDDPIAWLASCVLALFLLLCGIGCWNLTVHQLCAHTTKCDLE